MKTLTISSHYPNTALANCPGDAADHRALLAAAGMPPAILGNTDARVPVENYARLYRLISRRMDDEAFGYLPGRLPYGTFAIGAEYAAHSDNVGEALTKICRYYRVVSDDFRLTLERADRLVSFELHLMDPGRDRWGLLTEIMLCIGYLFTSWLAGRSIDLDQTRFAFGPPRHLQEYIYLFPCPLHFDQASSAVVFDRQFLDLPVLKSRSQIADYLSRTPYDLMTKLLGGNSVSTRVYGALSTAGQDGRHDLPAIAADLGMTEQTLRRKLRAEGATFRRIKHQLRKDTAIYHLMNSDQKLAEIAEVLGFSTPGAFSRAFKSWTGMPPDTYRNRDG